MPVAGWSEKNEIIFEDKAAHAAHANSDAVKRFEAAYRPELDGGDVVFTDYEQVAKS